MAGASTLFLYPPSGLGRDNGERDHDGIPQVAAIDEGGGGMVRGGALTDNTQRTSDFHGDV